MSHPLANSDDAIRQNKRGEAMTKTPRERALEDAIETLVSSAYRCGISDTPSFCVPHSADVYGYDKLKQAITQAVNDEREACAKVIDTWHIKKGGYGVLAQAIRERGENV